MKRIVILFAMLMCFGTVAFSQEEQLLPTYLTIENSGKTDTLPAIGIQLFNETVEGLYTEGIDYWYTVYSPCEGSKRLLFTVESFDVDETDTVFIYDGPTIYSPLLAKGNNSFSSLYRRRYFVSPTNSSNCLTVRIKTNTDGRVGTGFSIRVSCQTPCEDVVPVIEDKFYRTRNGEIYDSAYIVKVEGQDTSDYYYSMNVCAGDGIIIKGHGEYSYFTGYYEPYDETSLFSWQMNNGDNLEGLNEGTFTVDQFATVACYQLSLRITDIQGCGTDMIDVIRIRVAGNPIESITDNLAVFCNDTCILLTTSASSDSIASTLTINPTPSTTVSKSYDVKTFIPDGPNCPALGLCYTAEIEFTEFPPGRTITSGADVCSVCINYEHSFMGDYDLSIVCPTGSKSVLKYKNAPTGLPADAGGGSGTFTGYPFGGNNHDPYDGRNGNNCDSIYNMYGVGLDYCFSRNGDYTLVDGMPANTTSPGSHYIASSGYTISVTYNFGSIPAPYDGAGTNVGTASFSTKKPSDHENKSDYYMPADDFSQLIGCPLNGLWSIEVCDSWSIDNGWVFSWSMDICDVSQLDDCEYIVGIDSIRWSADYSVGGVVARIVNDDSAYVSTPDTAGVFPVVAHVHDEFGCVWDTTTHITTTWTPMPSIPSDTSICDPESVVIDATDRHHDEGEFTYSWQPFGETTPVVNTRPWLGMDTSYIVTVVNRQFGLACTRYDTTRVHVFPVPIPGFSTNVIPAAGCSPFEIQFVDTSKYGYTYEWRFGDGFTSTSRNPYHTYSAGRYDVTEIVTSDFGCIDSLTQPQYVWAFHTPDAQFLWEPEYPTFNSPMVQFVNQTYPMISDNIYEWSFQSDASGENYSKAYSLNPSYTWSAPLTAGDYRVKLVSRTDNYDQDGNLIVCRDSVETTIMLIQDFIQFPTVITPNGDGINDRFVIHGLVDGLAYPNNSLHIYNRWGMLVYSKENMRLDEDYWDPAADRAPAGTYFYYFNARGYTGGFQRNGSFEVMRY